MYAAVVSCRSFMQPPHVPGAMSLRRRTLVVLLAHTALRSRACVGRPAGPGGPKAGRRICLSPVRDEGFQRPGVAHRIALAVIVEVREDPVARLEPLHNPVRP